MNKTFGELSIGDRFTVDGQEFVKVAEVKISCCHKVNAHDANNPATRKYFQPSQTVTINA